MSCPGRQRKPAGCSPRSLGAKKEFPTSFAVILISVPYVVDRGFAMKVGGDKISFSTKMSNGATPVFFSHPSLGASAGSDPR